MVDHLTQMQSTQKSNGTLVYGAPPSIKAAPSASRTWLHTSHGGGAVADLPASRSVAWWGKYLITGISKGGGVGGGTEMRCRTALRLSNAQVSYTDVCCPCANPFHKRELLLLFAITYNPAAPKPWCQTCCDIWHHLLLSLTKPGGWCYCSITLGIVQMLLGVTWSGPMSSEHSL